MKSTTHPISVAPMMDWTDRHCRFLHRLLTRRALLYRYSPKWVMYGPGFHTNEFPEWVSELTEAQRARNSRRPDAACGGVTVARR